MPRIDKSKKQKRNEKKQKIEQYSRDFEFDQLIYNYRDCIICRYHFRKWDLSSSALLKSLGCLFVCLLLSSKLSCHTHIDLNLIEFVVWLTRSCIHFLCSMSMQKMGLVSCYADIDSTSMSLSTVCLPCSWIVSSSRTFFFIA